MDDLPGGRARLQTPPATVDNPQGLPRPTPQKADPRALGPRHALATKVIVVVDEHVNVHHYVDVIRRLRQRFYPEAETSRPTQVTARPSRPRTGAAVLRRQA